MQAPYPTMFISPVFLELCVQPTSGGVHLGMGLIAKLITCIWWPISVISPNATSAEGPGMTFRLMAWWPLPPLLTGCNAGKMWQATPHSFTLKHEHFWSRKVQPHAEQDESFRCCLPCCRMREVLVCRQPRTVRVQLSMVLATPTPLPLLLMGYKTTTAEAATPPAVGLVTGKLLPV